MENSLKKGYVGRKRAKRVLMSILTLDINNNNIYKAVDYLKWQASQL